MFLFPFFIFFYSKLYLAKSLTEIQNNPAGTKLEEAHNVNAQQITWNLTELFRDISDTKIEQAISEATAGADQFERKYRGKIGGLSAEGLLQCLREVEAFEAKFSDIALF